MYAAAAPAAAESAMLKRVGKVRAEAGLRHLGKAALGGVGLQESLDIPAKRGVPRLAIAILVAVCPDALFRH